jgi:hypothetical protein
MLLPRIEPVGKASAAGSIGLIGAKSLFSSSGGLEAQAPSAVVIRRINIRRIIALAHYRF